MTQTEPTKRKKSQVPIEEQVKSLLRLAQESPNIHEAETAAAKAAMLIELHNVRPELLIMNNREEVLGALTNMVSMYTYADSTRKSTWIHLICIAVGKKTSTVPAVAKRHVRFFGREVNVKSAILIFNYLYSTLCDIVDEEKKNYVSSFKRKWGMAPGSLGGQYHPQTWRKSWLLGAAQSIHDRLIEKEQHEDQETVKALAIVSEGEIREFMSDWGITGKKSKGRNHNYNRGAIDRGSKVGGSINLNPNSRLEG